MFDISQEEDYRELTLEEQYLVNGGAEVANTNEAVANSKPGDTVTRDDKTTHVITQGDINWAKEHCGSNTGGAGNGNTGQPSYGSGGPSGNSGGSSGSGSGSSSSDNRGYPSSMDGYYDAKLKKLHEYNPDETNTDKKFTARDFNGKHLMTVYYANAVKFEDAAAYYLSFGKWGTAETTTYDGIGLTDEKGNITRILTKEKEVLDYVESFDPRNKTYEPYLLNNETIENNQYKTEKALYGKFEKTRNGFIAKFDGWLL